MNLGGLHPFRDRRRGPQRVTVKLFGVRVRSQIQPDNLTAGEQADHSVSVVNHDSQMYAIDVRSRCGGPSLVYGTTPEWAPPRALCPPGQTTPAAATKIALPAGAAVPAPVEQVSARFVVEMVDPSVLPEAPQLAVHTLHVAP